METLGYCFHKIALIAKHVFQPIVIINCVTQDKLSTYTYFKTIRLIIEMLIVPTAITCFKCNEKINVQFN